MSKVNVTTVVVIICALLVGALLALTHHTAFEHTPIYGWGGYAYQMITAAIGCAAFSVTIRSILDAKNRLSLASLLPIASLPAWMGVIATVWNYHGIYYVYSALPVPPKFAEIANAYDHALSYLMIGLVASFPSFMTIAVALYVRIARDL